MPCLGPNHWACTDQIFVALPSKGLNGKAAKPAGPNQMDFRSLTIFLEPIFESIGEIAYKYVFNSSLLHHLLKYSLKHMISGFLNLYL